MVGNEDITKRDAKRWGERGAGGRETAKLDEDEMRRREETRDARARSSGATLADSPDGTGGSWPPNTSYGDDAGDAGKVERPRRARKEDV